MVAGEPSADRQGAALLTALRVLAAPRLVEAYGIGGQFMEAAGVTLLSTVSRGQALGLPKRSSISRACFKCRRK